MSLYEMTTIPFPIDQSKYHQTFFVSFFVFQDAVSLGYVKIRKVECNFCFKSSLKNEGKLFANVDSFASWHFRPCLSGHSKIVHQLSLILPVLESIDEINYKSNQPEKGPRRSEVAFEVDFCVTLFCSTR